MILYNKRAPIEGSFREAPRTVAWTDNNEETDHIIEGVDFRKLRQSGVLTAQSLANADFGDGDVKFCQFGGMDMRNIRVSGTQFHGCCFDAANLYGADLGSVYFHGCSFLNTHGIIDLGIMDEYQGFAYFHKNVGEYMLPRLMIRFGCTSLCYEDAVEHWSDRDGRTMIRRAVDTALMVAANHVKQDDWPVFRLGSQNIAFNA